MRPSKKFRLSSMSALEGRVVLSHVFNLTADMNVDRPPAEVAQTLSPSAMVPGAPAAPAGGNTFPADISATLKAGTPVYEQTQTTHSNSTNSTITDELIVPDPATGGSTTTEWIENLKPGNQTTVEKVVNVKTVDGNTTTNNITTTLPNGTTQTEVETAVTSDNTTTHTNVTTLADGTVQTSKYTDVKQGNRTLIEDGSQPAPDGSTETYSGVKFTIGDKTYTYKTYRQPGGVVKATDNVVTNLGDSGQNEATRTDHPHGPVIVTNSATVVDRLNPPTS